MIKRKIKNFISVIYTAVRFSILRLFSGGRFTYDGMIQRWSPNTSIELRKTGTIHLGKRTRIHHGATIVSQGELVLGDNVAFNIRVGIYCFDKIVIGDGTEFGPNTMIFDHDHDVRVEGGYQARKFKTAPVMIGKNVWLGANTIVLRGATIGDNCVIAAGSVVKGNVPANTVLIQKRETSFYAI